MPVKVELTFREDDLASLRLSPEEFAKEIRLAAAVKWYEIGLISQAKASEIAGISRGEFIEALKRFKCSPFQFTPEELEDEVVNV